MSKEIIRIIQNDEGGENPKTKLPEKPLWELVFEDNTINIFSLVAEVSLKTLLGKYFGTLAVISSAFFVSVSDAMKNSLIPV